jgi:hypothetical protein
MGSGLAAARRPGMTTPIRRFRTRRNSSPRSPLYL